MKTINDFLQWMGVSNGSVDSVRKNVIKGINIVLAIFILVVLLAISVLFGVFFWLESYVHTLIGVDIYIAKVISLLILIVFFGTPIKGFVWSFLPIIPRKDKKKKRVLFLLTLAVFFSISYFASRGVYFNPETGKSLQYYSIGLKGEYKFYSSDGYDPVTGAKLLPATPDVIRKYKASIDSTENINRDGVVGMIKDFSDEYRNNLKNEDKTEEVISNDSKNNINNTSVVDKSAGVTIASDNSIKKNIKRSDAIKKIIKYIKKNQNPDGDGISIENLDKNSELYKLIYDSEDTHLKSLILVKK